MQAIKYANNLYIKHIHKQVPLLATHSASKIKCSLYTKSNRCIPLYISSNASNKTC